MANLAETETWEAGIYQFSEDDVIDGGIDGTDNVPTRQLANRTSWLKAQIIALGNAKQPMDATLTALANLVTAADRMIYSTGPDTFALTPLTAFIRTLLDDADAAAARTTLGAISQAQLDAAIAALVASSPAALDTLNELAAALGNDANFAATVNNAIALRLAITEYQKASAVTAAAGGTADAITAAFVPAMTTDVAGRIPTVTVMIIAAAANTGAGLTIDVGTGAFGVVKGSGAAVVSGDVHGAGHVLHVRGVRGANAATDKWVLLNPATGVANPTIAGIQGSFRNLVGSAPGNSAVATYTLDELVTGDGLGAYQSTRNWNVTVNMASAGAGGLDTGLLTANTWYNAYGITKPDGTKSAIASLSASGPVLPAGYTKWARIGAIRTDGSASKFPLGFTQRGRYVTLLIGCANVPTAPLMASGAAGTFNTSTFAGVAVSWANYAPPSAAKIRVGMSANNTAIVVGVASNASRSGYATANPPELGYDSNAYPLITYGDLQLESANIYWASQGGVGYLLSAGWEDNL